MECGVGGLSIQVTASSEAAAGTIAGVSETTNTIWIHEMGIKEDDGKDTIQFIGTAVPCFRPFGPLLPDADT